MFEDSYDIDDFDLLEGLDFLESDAADDLDENTDDDVDFGKLEGLVYDSDDTDCADDEDDEFVENEADLSG